jgi:CRP-like cAMP-binding protein
MPDTARQVKLLKEMPVFGGMSDAILDFLLAQIVVRSYQRGDYVFREGEQSTSMFVLEWGEIAILKQCDSHQYLLRTMKAGDCIGEMALFDFMPRSASALVLEETQVLEITSTNLMAIYRQDIEQFAMMTLNMGREVTRRLRMADERCYRNRIEAQIREGTIDFFEVDEWRETQSCQEKN